MRLRRVRRTLFLLAAVAFGISSAACGGALKGTYSNGGTVILELRSGGKADLTAMGDLQHCTWKGNDKKVVLTCKDDSIDFLRHDDGSLTGPPGSFMPVLKKEKN